MGEPVEEDGVVKEQVSVKRYRPPDLSKYTTFEMQVRILPILLPNSPALAYLPPML